MKSLIIASLLFLTAFSGTGHAMARKPNLQEQAKIDRVNICLRNASEASRLAPVPGAISAPVDQDMLKAGYCTCYTLENDTQLMLRYCF